MFTRSPQEWYYHTRDIYRCYVQDQTFLWLARLQTVSNTASSKRFHYVWTILHKVGGTSATRSSQLGDFAFGLHYFSHPMPALYCFVIMWLRHTQHGVGCLAQSHERTRLTMKIERKTNSPSAKVHIIFELLNFRKWIYINLFVDKYTYTELSQVNLF